MVSFDVERETPERLKYYAAKSGLNKNRTLLHGHEDAVRTLSVILNVQYEKDAGGNFSHSNIVSVLDKQGPAAISKRRPWRRSYRNIQYNKKTGTTALTAININRQHDSAVGLFLSCFQPAEEFHLPVTHQNQHDFF